MIIMPDDQGWQHPLPPGSPPIGELRAFMNNCEAGNEKEVEAYLKRRPAFLEPQWDNILTTPLMLAARKGHDKIIKLLIDAGIPVHTRDADGNTALYCALYEGKLGTVKLLLDNGADLSLRPRFGSTALMAALHSGSEALVRLLLGKGEKPDDHNDYGQNALHALRWCPNSSVDFAALLVKHGADVNCAAQNGDTPLADCMLSNCAKTVRRLLDLGADLVDGNKMSILHEAKRLGLTDEIIKMLEDEPWRREKAQRDAIEEALAKVRARDTAIENAVHNGVQTPMKPMRLKLKL
ncbi:MAG: hypothetical protein EPN97_00965 [Alphaproteobacteria bacterium]|nr:MAG: hypothetical protein EPN97_00965 [Alphaproteobacteria bacterium]